MSTTVVKRFDPPPSDRYASALSAMGERVTPELREMLRAQYAAPDRTATARELAHAAGYENRGAANLHYGRLGKDVAEAMGLAPAEKGWPVLSVGLDTEGGFLWKMHDEAAAALEALGWVDATDTAEASFLAELDALRDGGAVYRSPVYGDPYAVRSVDQTGAHVDRLRDGKSAPVTAPGYARALSAVRGAGGRLPVRDLDATDAVRTTYVQGPALALGPDGDAVYVPTPRAAADLLVAHIGRLLDDAGADPKPYRPALVACVVDAVGAGEVTDNRFEFDALVARFEAKTAEWGHPAGAEQAALAFYHLATRPFWLLAYVDPTEAADGRVRTPTAIRTHIRHARLGAPYWRALQDPDARARVARAARDAWAPDDTPDDPDRTPRVVKVAPGRDADRWPECRDGGFICVGWDDVGDLREYDDYDEFAEAFSEAYPYKGNAALQTRKGRELWTLRELRPGDLVVANRGTREVLAVGTVVASGYAWRPDRESYRHTVAVDWDEDYAKTIPKQGYWAFVTVHELDPEIAALVLDEAPPREPDPDGLAEVLEHPAGRLLLRRKNVVLYGPPGTGKTRSSLQLAAAWERWHGAGSVEQVTFHPTFSYEDFVEGFRPNEETGQFELRPGLFVELCERARTEPKRAFLLLVDELNRGDVARILGELVTLLEPDKRTPRAERRLPYSHDPFWVPPNVHLLGTMNTADRSVSLLDVAVRRRFAFVETPPDPSVLDRALIPEVGGVRLSELLRGLNARLARVGVDRDRAVGHSVLLLDDGGAGAALSEAAPSPDLSERAVSWSPDGPEALLVERLRYDVLPLVEEYAYADRSLVGRVLGPLVGDDGRADEATFSDPDRLFAALADIAADGRG